MPEREFAVCFADEGLQARNSCPELPIFFLLASHGLLLHVSGLPETFTLSHPRCATLAGKRTLVHSTEFTALFGA